MPEAPAEGADAGWRDRLRHFYVTGAGGDDSLDPLVPLSLAGFFDPQEVFRHYPLVVDDTDDVLVRPFSRRVDAVFEAMAGNGQAATILPEHETRLVWAFSNVLPDAGQAELGAVVDQACARFLADFEISPEAGKALEREIIRFKKLVPRDGTLLGLGPRTLPAVYRAVLRRDRGERLAAFVERASALLTRLSDVLRLDDARAPSAAKPEALAASMGDLASDLFDTQALASSLPHRSGSTALAADRKSRITQTVEVLRTWLKGAPTSQELVIVHRGQADPSLRAPGVELVSSADPLGTAAGRFDAEVEKIVAVVRAMRVGRLEADGDYDPAVHDSQISRLDWHGLSADELRLVTPIAVTETRERLREGQLPALSSLLRSGRPIHVLVGDASDVAAGQALGESTFDLGYLALAHREAFALQTSLSSPTHLVDGLTQMVAAVRPALAVVATPSPTLPPWLSVMSRVAGRGMPEFRYDPGAGPSWAHRFSVDQNAQPERPWPVHSVLYENPSGTEESMPLPFTFADAAALDATFRRHFWVLPTEAWGEDQAPVSALLEAEGGEIEASLPFIWVVAEDGRLARALMTREMAMSARDHLRSWHTLQELGGLDNEHVKRAASAATERAWADAAAEREALEALHAQQLERVRAEAAEEAMGRLVDVLMDLDSAPRTTSRAAAPAAAPAPAPRDAGGEPAPAPAAEAAPVAEEEDDVSFDEAWIDGPLCTTCNECTNINSRLFKYNGDNQAYIADINAGTYLQMVTAAEKCPARCIHPGAPRSDDETATEELRARAAKFG